MNLMREHTKSRNKSIARCAENGMDIKDICSEYGLSLVSIRRILNLYNIGVVDSGKEFKALVKKYTIKPPLKKYSREWTDAQWLEGYRRDYGN